MGINNIWTFPLLFNFAPIPNEYYWTPPTPPPPLPHSKRNTGSFKTDVLEILIQINIIYDII